MEDDDLGSPHMDLYYKINSKNIYTTIYIKINLKVKSIKEF
jgi:hypothetical protein